MPVIQLPQDTRWGDLGAGLGNVIGSVLQGVQKKQAQAGVAQVMQDPSIPEDKKAVKILEKFGDVGYNEYKQAKTLELLGGQVKDTLADAKIKELTAARQGMLMGQVGAATSGRTGAGTTASAVDSAITASGATNVTPQQRADWNSQYVTALLAGSKDPMTSILPQIKMAAEAPKLSAETTNATNTAAASAYKPAIAAGEAAAAPAKAVVANQDAAKGAASVPTATDASSPAALKAQYPGPTGLTDQQAQIVSDKAKTGGPKAAVDAAEKFISQNQTEAAATARQQEAAQIRANAPQSAPTDVRKLTENSVEAATSAQRFMKDFTEGGSQQLGLLRGASVKTLMERYGMPTGDAQLVDMWNASYQQVASAATSGGALSFSNGRVQLAKDVTPGITETPLHALLAADQVADRQIALLRNAKASLTPNVDQKGVDDALAKWQSVKSVTGSLQSYVVRRTDGTPDKTVMMFNGNQIDPKTFDVEMKGTQSFPLGAKMTASGATIMADALRLGITPQERLAELQTHFGGQ
jgi:hypothetical protein